MTNGRQVHSEELVTDIALARGLVASQFPMWAQRPIVPVLAASTDNDIYRLGTDMAVRLPRRASAETPLDNEHAWLPRLASHMSLSGLFLTDLMSDCLRRFPVDRSLLAKDGNGRES